MKLTTLAATLLPLAILSVTAPIDQITFTSPVDLSISALRLDAALAQQLAEHVASLPERRVVQISPRETLEITEGEKAILVAQRIRFEDVTEQESFTKVQAQEDFPKLQYSMAQLQPLFDTLDLHAMKKFLTAFTGFRTRYYRSETGKDSQAFLLAHLRSIVESNPSSANITITEFAHPWGQNSIIARFAPSSSVSESTVIIGAHQDSTNLLPFLPAPGADDDGSGTTSILTSFKTLVKAGFVPSQNAVEFHWYSAEEGGLLGSQAVAQDYARKGRKVRAFTQFDMTAWVKRGSKPTIGSISDFTDNAFTTFLREVIDEYSTIGWTDTLCGYACSDHASWSKVGVPAAFAIESTFADSSHNIHSTSDTIDYSDEFSFEHMAEFSRVALGIAVELGGGKNLFAH